MTTPPDAQVIDYKSLTSIFYKSKDQEFDFIDQIDPDASSTPNSGSFLAISEGIEYGDQQRDRLPPSQPPGFGK